MAPGQHIHGGGSKSLQILHFHLSFFLVAVLLKKSIKKRIIITILYTYIIKEEWV